jgi:heme/copper-type cytochrome/quinol oxidase subunit 3
VSIEAEKVGLIEKKAAVRPTVRLGMVFFLISEAFLFGSLFWTYYYLRAKTAQWPPAGVTLDSNLAYVNTAILLSSSLVIWWAGRSIRRGGQRGLTAGLIAVMCLGIAFLGITGYEWSHETFRPWTHAYGSIFYTMTGFHALHVLAGVFLMLSLLARTLRGRFSAQKYLAVEVGSLYWHFVDFIWLIVFTTLFIVR